MAWPYTAYQTMVDGTPPTWNAAFGNALQAGITGLYSGTTPLGGTFAGIVLPTPAFTKSVLYKEMCPLAMARISNAGAAALVWGVNIAAPVTRVGTGNVTVNLALGAGAAADLLPQATPASNCNCSTFITSASAITVVTENDAGAGIDTDFFLVVYSRT